ncbi:hypothetical protein BO70DRAFT_396360 [Aspergillus heteromorphus CBS 117.55]|uniref:Uncharacterized protein n=1 Tax=Aspergillus heteromorphus CBS 117.55 TaxID=1448321 RepID=A0A317WD27_9EURO|nr:uncharacterized protein BO70DRAFT_396360 [Aspergillus heteromorphus CBS 117.55]PWY82070.1 hypothetical protein BO70DRAFT_396360 [Aspergillus heteromorphus CBS 117.55]
MSGPGDFDYIMSTDVTMNQGDVYHDFGTPYAGIKFACQNATTNTRGLMRMYRQIPIMGTAFRPARVRALQARPQRTHEESLALRSFKE